MTVYLPVLHAHCTRVRFTVLMSCSDEFTVHSCPLQLPAYSRQVKVGFGGEGNWGDRPPKTCRPLFCRRDKVHFISLAVVNP